MNIRKYLVPALAMTALFCIGLAVADQVEQVDRALTPDQARATLAADPMVVALPPYTPWTYAQTNHGLTGQPIREACVRSTNVIQLDWPYEPQRLMLCLRMHPEWGQDAIIRLPEGGQFVCRYSGCSARVRMGGAAPSNYTLGESSDGDNDMLFISNDRRFVQALRGVSEVAIEATYYRAGNQTALFDTTGLEWDVSAEMEQHARSR